MQTEKRIFAKLAVIIVLMLAVLSSSAIEGLKLQIHCPNVVLLWPSAEGETYIVQFRETLDTNSSWVTLTNQMPPDAGTNITVFVHSNRVDCPPGQIIGVMRSTDGENASLSSTAAPLTIEEENQLWQASEEARLAALYEKCKLEGREPHEWELKNTPPLPPSPEEVMQQLLKANADKAAGPSIAKVENAQADETGLEGGANGPQPAGGGSGEPGCGFYRVVRNGVHTVGLTNTPLSGLRSFILEVGLDDTSAPVIGFSVGRHDQGSLNGLTTSPATERLQIAWDTAQTTNGTYSLVPEVELADGTVITGAVKTVTVENAISFPNGYQYAGDAMYLQAHTLHTNGTWHMDFYDDQDAYLGFLDGNVSANGYCDYPGIPSPGFSIGLLDNQGNQLPSSYYSVVVTTTPPETGGITPAGAGGSGSAKATNKIVVERRWAGNKWAIAYQTVYPLNSAADLQLNSMMGQIVGGIQEGPYGNHAVINSPYAVTPNPFKLRFTSHWQQLAVDSSDETVRNFVYFGHGSKKSIGSGDVNTSMNREFLQFVLKNSPDPLVGTNRHPYRLVFLDGCDTAKGDLCLDFGIPKQTIYATNMISRYGLRPRAFLGWKTGIGTSVKNTLPQTHAKFISRFFEIWPQVNPNSNYYYTLRDALDAAAIDPDSNEVYTDLHEDITIYGCPDLYFYD